jgi:hydrogenase nickel incorporation protein HypA/HybF
MHEFAIVSNLFEIMERIAAENNLKKISSVTLSVGKMRQVVPVAMDMAFEAITKGTLAEGAKLQLEFVPIRMKCASCKSEFDVESHVYICPGCESGLLELIEGQELLIKSMEGED